MGKISYQIMIRGGTYGLEICLFLSVCTHVINVPQLYYCCSLRYQNVVHKSSSPRKLLEIEKKKKKMQGVVKLTAHHQNISIYLQSTALERSSV